MTRRAIDIYPVDVATAVAWLIGLALAVLAMTYGSLTPWCMAAACTATGSSVLSYVARKLEHLEGHHYTEGFQAGLEARRVLHLVEPPHRN